MTIYGKRLMNSDGTTSTVAEIVAALQEDAVPQRRIDAWVIGLEQAEQRAGAGGRAR